MPSNPVLQNDGKHGASGNNSSSPLQLWEFGESVSIILIFRIEHIKGIKHWIHELFLTVMKMIILTCGRVLRNNLLTGLLDIANSSNQLQLIDLERNFINELAQNKEGSNYTLM